MTFFSKTVCLLPDESWRLVTRLTKGHELPARATLAASLVAMIRTGQFGLVILDPFGFRDDLYEAALTAADEIGVILCLLATLTTVAAVRALQSSKRLPTEVVFRDAGGAGRVIQHLLGAGGVLSASAWLLHVLAPCIARLAPPVRTVIVGLFGGRATPRVVQDLADAAGVGRRAVERAVSAAGLRSAKRLLDTIRVARAWDAMATTRRSLHDVSDDAGFPSVRTLVDQFHFFVGLPPRRSTKQIDSRDFAGRLVLRLLDGVTSASSETAPAAAEVRSLERAASPVRATVRRNPALDDANPPGAT